MHHDSTDFRVSIEAQAFRPRGDWIIGSFKCQAALDAVYAVLSC